jgi:hypothetical protein
MDTRTMMLLLGLTLAISLGALGCAAPADKPEPVPPETEAPAPETPADGDAAGSQLAPGLYDLADGSVQALGVLEWRDLEGGFWAILSTTAADPAEGTIVAVIAPGTDLDDSLKALKGKTVMVTGTRFEGASIRMAGPEIVPTAVEEISDTAPDAAD